MKLKIHKNDLSNILNIIEIGLTANNVIKSLKGIKITVTQNNISFLTSKNEMAINYTIQNNKLDLEIDEEGSIIIPGTEFINIIRKLNSSYIRLEQEGNLLNIKNNKSFIQLISLDKSSYPSINFELSDPTEVNLNKNILIEAYNKTKYSVDTNPINPILSGINFKINENLKVSSTDSLRMTLFTAAIQHNNNNEFTINKNLLKDLIKILENQDTEEIHFLINNNQLLIKTENIHIKIRLLDGNYPNIEKIIPQNTNFSYELEKKSILESLERVVLLTERNESIVICTIEDNLLNLKTSHKFLGKIEDKCSIKNLQGTPFKIAFDPHFLMDALNTMEDNIKFEFVDEVSGFMIKNTENNNIINIISPIRIN